MAAKKIATPAKKRTTRETKPHAADADAELEVPEEERLSLREKLFVLHYTGEAKGVGNRAAKLAGYNGDNYTLAVTAYKLLRRPRVKAAIDSVIESDPLIVSRAERLHIRSQIARDTKATEAARLAALDSLDRAQGHHAAHKLELDMSDRAAGAIASLSTAQLLAEVLGTKPPEGEG